jgi:cyclophilin family peptidyl-prolyl cis-trans isomerase
MTRLEDEHGDNLRVVFRHFPLISIHDKAILTAEAAEAAGAQGAFWEMMERIFEGQQEWSSVTPDQASEILVGYATELGLDTERFADDLETGAFREKVMASYDEATAVGLPGTPTFFFNDQYFQAPLSYYYLDAFVRLELLAEDQYPAAPEMVIDPQKRYQATIKTEKGDLIVELEAEKAPATVNNFVFLAREGWYDGATFFRVLPGFVAQAGDPTNTGIGGPGYQFADEFHPDLKHDQVGVLSMANAGPNTNGSQFFVTYAPAPWLDAYDENGELKDCELQEVSCHAVFGRVTEGMDVLETLTPRDPSQNPELPPGDAILTIEIEELP